MKTPRPLSLVALLASAALAGGLAPSPASARATHKHPKPAASHRARTAAHPKSIRGIGTHGTATTGTGQGTSTNMVPAGGTNADPLGGGTTSTGTATNGTGTSNK